MFTVSERAKLCPAGARDKRDSRDLRDARMAITRFEDLEVWREAVSLAVEVYSVSKSSALSQDFGFRDQLQRAAVSIASNIAEGKERETIPELIRYLYIAKGSSVELKT